MEKYILRTLNLTPEDVKSIDPIPSKNGQFDYLITLKIKEQGLSNQVFLWCQEAKTVLRVLLW